jgi:hypothetical protein
LVAVHLIDGQLPYVATFLSGDGTGLLLFPCVGAVETAGAAGRADRVAIDKCAVLKVCQRRCRTSESLARIGIVALQRELAVPGGATAGSVIGRKNIGDLSGGISRCMRDERSQDGGEIGLARAYSVSSLK